MKKQYIAPQVQEHKFETTSRIMVGSFGPDYHPSLSPRQIP